MPRQLRRRMTTEDTIEDRYRHAVLNYLYLQSKRRSIAISMLPPDMLGYFGCIPREIGKRTTTFDVKVPEGVGKDELEGRIRKITFKICALCCHMTQSAVANRKMVRHITVCGCPKWYCMKESQASVYGSHAIAYIP